MEEIVRSQEMQIDQAGSPEYAEKESVRRKRFQEAGSQTGRTNIKYLFVSTMLATAVAMNTEIEILMERIFSAM
jgi:hypothetical protein